MKTKIEDVTIGEVIAYMMEDAEQFKRVARDDPNIARAKVYGREANERMEIIKEMKRYAQKVATRKNDGPNFNHAKVEVTA